MLPMPALLAVLALGALPVRVEAPACPSAADIEQSLSTMLPSVATDAERDVAHLTPLPKGLEIELVNAEGAVLATRRLEQDGTCTEMAALAAVIIASWESDVHPEFARLSPSSVSLVAARPSASPSPPSARPQGGYDLAAGGVVSVADALAVGAALAATWIPRAAGLGARLFAEGETARTAELAQRQARWQRWTGSVELDWRVIMARSALDFHGGLALGWLSASGVSFDVNQSARALSPGVAVGARWALWSSYGIAGFVDVSAFYWLRTQTLSSASDGAEWNIPRFQGLASLGLAVGKPPSRP